MDIQALEARKPQLERRYSELQQQINALSVEMHQLEGAFSEIEYLIKESRALDGKAKNGPSAPKPNPASLRPVK